MSSDELREAVRGLSLEELKEHAAHVRALVKEAEASRKRHAGGKGRGKAKPQAAGKKRYRQYVRCGKRNCHCATGKGHGPYVYCFWRENGRTRSEYIGRKPKE